MNEIEKIIDITERAHHITVEAIECLDELTKGIRNRIEELQDFKSGSNGEYVMGKISAYNDVMLMLTNETFWRELGVDVRKEVKESEGK